MWTSSRFYLGVTNNSSLYSFPNLLLPEIPAILFAGDSAMIRILSNLKTGISTTSDWLTSDYPLSKKNTKFWKIGKTKQQALQRMFPEMNVERVSSNENLAVNFDDMPDSIFHIYI